MNPLPQIHGHVLPEFAAVRDAFAANFTARGEVGAAVCVVRDGETVVDLWGGVRDRATRTPWEADTLVGVFSVTKGMTAVALAVAHARGHLDYDERVATYWPEFAAHGKERITVRQLLAHQAGLCALDAPVTPDLLRDPVALDRLLARQKPAWTPGQWHGYHNTALGFYASALLRHIDPRGRGLGQFFHEEIALPLGVEFYIGLPEVVPDQRVAVVQGFRPWQMLLHLNAFPSALLRELFIPGSLVARTLSNPKVAGPADYTTPRWTRVEFGGAGGVGNARAIARIYGALAAGGGALNLPPATLDELSAPPETPSSGAFDLILKHPAAYRHGFARPDPSWPFAGRRAFGTPGAGGAFAFADPDERLGYAYVTNTMGFGMRDDRREVALREAVQRCLKAQR